MSLLKLLRFGGDGTGPGETTPVSENDDSQTLNMPIDAARILLKRAMQRCGSVSGVARSVADACIDAQAEGQDTTGFGAAADYCDALLDRRVDGTAVHSTERPTPVMFCVDARRGFTHPAFDAEFEELVETTQRFGIALFALRNGYASGALGFYVRRLASKGLVGIALANAGPALMAPAGGRQRVFCTNPIAFGAPRSSGYPLVIDQSTSQAAAVNLRRAAENGHEIPLGWALDANGAPTTDPKRALEGVLLAFGGERGANIALMVEMLAAGVTGANWSLDAPSFMEGSESPGAGLMIIAINPALICGDDFSSRADVYLKRLRTEFDAYIPGERRGNNKQASHRTGLTVERKVVNRLNHFIRAG